ncbi:alpha-galactosidase [Actinoplanes sp. NPDC051494]|uniref:alpha-galactosidase n=1 Tax=Actinoplanes sp. NPDC051494 TaxID=3363907 RepID=UPI0037B34DBC
MLIHLRAAGTSVVLDARGPRPPVLLHWGADLGELSGTDLATLAGAPAVSPSSIDEPFRPSLLASRTEGWTGRPALSGHWTADGAPPAAFTLTGVRDITAGSATVELTSADDRLRVVTSLELTPQGVLRVRHELSNHGSGTFDLASLDVLLPIPDRAGELLDFSGLWSYERRPQRTTLRDGVWSRERRHGRPGHDDAFVLMPGTPGFSFRAGEVWGAHLAWSGDARLWAERSATGHTLLGSGELFAPGEMRIAPGARHTTPWTVATWSDAGIDGLSARWHTWIRSGRVRRDRPVTLNTWEAVYFDHDLPTLLKLVDAAAGAGVERFVLDDGWFAGRTDDRRALGDWTVDGQRWPDGLTPLIDAVQARGMEFGLWVEPEMISPDSALARAHPEWILDATSPTWRFQHVLDLAQPEAYHHVLGGIVALLDAYPIGFLKWDHNRDLLREGVTHRQTAALYRLLAELRQRFPGVEIESCASGGARVDLGILEHVDRFWTSDTNDALERQRIQRWTGVLVPPEFLGSHLGAPVAHITGRTGALGFRMATALFAHAGIEWDLTTAAPEDLAAVASWVETYKRWRTLLHTGTVVRSDGDDPARTLHGVVAADGSQALFAYVSMRSTQAAVPAPVRLPGLDPDHRYTVRPLTIGAEPRAVQDNPPTWWAEGEVTLPGRVLAEVGLPMPLLVPEQAAVLAVTRSDER